MADAFPPFIDALPHPNTPFPIRARIVPSEYVMTMFYEVDQQVDIPEHAHGPQWGVVLEGAMEMTIGGQTRNYSRGDTYYVKDGEAHIARLHSGYRGIDVFADPHRYEPLPDNL